MKVSLITTVLNEKASIEYFLYSVLFLSKKPDELIIVDGGSTDNTVNKALDFISKSGLNKHVKTEIVIKEGANRSEGRNLAIQKAKHEVIAISDAGCELDPKWLKNITAPFVYKKIDAVAGYYKAKTNNVFEKCVAPYALVMPDKIDPKNFLPSSRSMAIRKKTFLKFGGFPENFPDNEDYVFANTLKKGKANVYFCSEAIVFWHPRPDLKSFWRMIFRFARGDAKAGLRRFKVASIFFRYIFGFIFLALCMIFYSLVPYFLIMIFLYLSWSIFKNYKYVKDLRAVFILPVLQITSDMAILFGSMEGSI